MNCVLAGVKGIRDPERRPLKLLSDAVLFEHAVVRPEAHVSYDPDHNLDEDSWFKVDNFSARSYCMKWMKDNFNSADYNNLTRDQFSKIAYLCSIQSNEYCFQKVTPRHFLTKKVLVFGDVAKLDRSGCRLVVSSEPSAIYLKAEDVLVFRKLSTIASIFRGIDVLHAEATRNQVASFLGEPFIKLFDGYDVDKVSKLNRRRIALVQERLDAMSQSDRDLLINYINKYSKAHKLDYDQERKQFKIKTDGDLKNLLYGIDERFFERELKGDSCLANSIITLPGP